MKVSRAAFFGLISAGHVRMRAQIISECDVALDLWRICAEAMQLYDAKAAVIGKRAIAPPRDAELTVPFVAERFDALAFSIEVGQTGYQWHQIDDRLGSQPRHRG